MILREREREKSIESLMVGLKNVQRIIKRSRKMRDKVREAGKRVRMIGKVLLKWMFGL